MVRSFQKRRYIFVFIVTLIIFFLGLLLGTTINEKKSRALERGFALQNLDDLSTQLQFTFLNSIKTNSTEGCKVMKAALEQSWINLDQAYKNLVKYKDSPDADEETIHLLERNELLNNIRYWFLLNKAKTFCRLEDSVDVLYFFSDKECYICGQQSTILEYFKKLFDNRFLLFHINVDIDDPMVKLLANRYEITSYPTMIVDGEKYEGVIPKDELARIICEKFKTEQPECKNE